MWGGGAGCRVSGFGCKVSGLGLRVCGLRFGVQGIGSRVQESGCRGVAKNEGSQQAFRRSPCGNGVARVNALYQRIVELTYKHAKTRTRIVHRVQVVKRKFTYCRGRKYGKIIVEYCRAASQLVKIEELCPMTLFPKDEQRQQIRGSKSIVQRVEDPAKGVHV